MSRIGKKPITIPSDVKVSLTGHNLVVTGPKGKLIENFHPNITIKHEADEIIVTRSDDQKGNKALHGLTRALIQNMIIGVSAGYSKILDIVGVGYKAELKGKNLLITIGYSHPIYFLPPDDITLVVNTPTQISISGIDKQLVGAIAAKIRSIRKPEPYKGKGIKYSTETIRRKAGKTAGK
ncbi:MAG: 50S ribosomal protein L6 [Chlorobiaceae bacterium]|nr:50S ribosomal protein L6 [Chlorobiaceae bacterium]MBA4310138.1 50S ribosomal protein L6 [Chlorobiaceae bacterium]